MPADANITENVIKQLGKKVRLMEGFASLESAERFSRLLVGCYVFKRFTDSCRAKDNGKSPLQLAGIDTVRNRHRGDGLARLPPPAVSASQQHSIGRCPNLTR
jgi:hypothetical protein